MAASIILPGIGGSGEDHWQSLWELSDPTVVRFQPASWDKPELTDWMAALDRSVAEAGAPPILIAHSLACLLVVHWAAQNKRSVHGAFFVGVPDPASPAFPHEARSFTNPPLVPLPFPALIIASTNDPYASTEYAQTRANQWRAGFISAGALGHISSASELGEWPQGRDLLEAFRAGASRS